MSLTYQDSYNDWLKTHPKPVAPKVVPTKKAIAKAMPVQTKKKDPVKPWTWKSTDTHGYKTRSAWRKAMAALGKPTSGGFNA